MILNNVAETLKIAGKLAHHCPKPFVIFLQGPLGAGKTTFTRGFLQGLGFQGLVKSPTYTLVESYSLPQAQIYHFDLYRLHQAREVLDLGLADYLSKDSLCLFEWPEQGGDFMPNPDLTCRLSPQGDIRLLELVAHHQQATQLIKEIT